MQDNNTHIKKHNINKHKVFFILCFIFIFLLPVFILISTIKLSTLSSNLKSTNKANFDTSIQANTSTEEYTYWKEATPDKFVFKSLMIVDQPSENPNIDAMCTWAKKFGVDADSELECTAFVKYSASNTTFDWDDVGFATTNQLKAFLTFYGKNNGLVNFKSISFTNTDIEFGNPELWLSLAHYMPNLEEINILCTDSEHQSMTSLPVQIGANKFKNIKIKGENIGKHYTTFLYKDSPLINTLEQLTLDNCGIVDHLEEEKDDKNIYYATDVLFKDYYYCKKLVYLNLNNNKIQHIGTKLIALPSVVELHLRNNNINTWHNITSTGEELSEGIGQICFPNPSGINFVDIANNSISELIHLKPSEWNPTTLAKYKDTQNSRYSSLNFIDISAQTVDTNCFVFGNNISTSSNINAVDTISDMDVDLSNIYIMPSDLSDSEKIEYISLCLQDRKEALTSRKPQEYQPDLWRSLKLTSCAMPSIIDLFGDKCNYINVSSEGTPLQDFTISSDSKVKGIHKYIDSSSGHDVEKTEVREVKYYKLASNKVEPDNSCYFSSDTSSTFKTTATEEEIKQDKYVDTWNGAKIWKQGNFMDGESPFGSAYGVADTYNSFQYTINISPSYKITHPGSRAGEIVKSSYTYNIQIFNDESHVFYLLANNQYDEEGNPIISDYIKSISDNDISVDDVYSHFDELITYVGNENYWKYFKDKFDDRTYWTVDSVVNNKETRVMTITLTYPTYEYIQSKSSSSVKQTLLIHVNMSPAKDNTLEKILILILIIEVSLFVILLIPVTIFYIRTKKKHDELAATKTEQIQKKYKNETQVHVDIKQDKTVEKKLSIKERFVNSINTGDTSKTKEVKVNEKDIKPTQSITDSISIDDVLKDIE